MFLIILKDYAKKKKEIEYQTSFLRLLHLTRWPHF